MTDKATPDWLLLAASLPGRELTAFHLEDDPGLSGLARLVHYLDVGGDVVPEAAGFEGVLAGLRTSCADDDALLDAMTPVLDGLHEHFRGSTR